MVWSLASHPQNWKWRRCCRRVAQYGVAARREICFSHDVLAWHQNAAIVKHKSYNVRKIKAKIEAKEITHVTRRVGKSTISRQLKPSRKNSRIYECIDEERESNRSRWGDNGRIFIPGAPGNLLLRTYSAKTCKNIEIQSLQSAGKNSS